MIKIHENNLLTVVTVGSTALALLLSLSGALLFSTPLGLGIIAGSGIAIVNFVWLRSIMQRVLSLQTGRPTIYATVRYLLRLGVSAVLLYFILVSGMFSLTGLLVGLSVVVIMISICTLLFLIQNKGD